MKTIKKLIASLAISGLVLWTGPAMASTSYDPNDPYFDPSGTYVPPVAVEEIVTTEEATSTSVADDSAILNDQSDIEEVISAEDESNLDQNAEASNSETGYRSDNDSTIVGEIDSETNIDNEADIENNVNANANSGDNNSDQNTGNGSVETGNSDIAANIINLANTIIEGTESMALPIINYFGDLFGNLSLFGDEDSMAVLSNNSSLTNIASNDQTGAYSDNDAVIDENNNNNSILNNAGNILNNLFFGANSGNNSASQNTGDGDIATGDANVASNVVNFLNNTISASNMWLGMFNIFGNWTGDLLLPGLMDSNGAYGGVDMNAENSETGAGSDNDAINNLDSSSQTTINNDANIIDNVEINANTGENIASGNTQNGNILTGDTNIKNNMLTIANNTIMGGTWWMMIVNSLSGWQGAIVGAPDGSQTFVPFMYGSSATNTETGAGSENDAIIDVEQSSDTEINNDANTTNNLVLSANTGQNIASENTGNGNIQTGDANVMSNLVNFVNNTFNVDNWMFGIVNVFGSWNGSALFGDGSGGTTLQSSQANLSATNDSTGLGSDNDTIINNEESSELNIDNDLGLQSNQTIHANTGRNIADRNTGRGEVVTGEINADSAMAVYGNITTLEIPVESDLNIDAGNFETGAYSDNNAIVNVIGKMRIVINNVARVCKSVVMDLNTGDNSADKNTGEGSIITGDISAKFREKEVLNVVKIVICKENEFCPEKPEEEVTPPEVLPEILPEQLPEQEVLGELLPAAGVGIGLPLALVLLIGLTYWRRKSSKILAVKKIKIDK